MTIVSEAPQIIKCVYNKTFQYTKQEWYTFSCTQKESLRMQKAIKALLFFIKQNYVTMHVVDLKKCTGSFTKTDMEWFTGYVIPKKIEYGVKYLANITARDTLAQQATEEWQKKAASGLIIKNFPTEKAAVDWLETKKTLMGRYPSLQSTMNSKE